MITTISTGITCIIIGGLFGFFITTITQRKIMKTLSQEIVKTSIQEHSLNCDSQKEIAKLHNGMIYLVTKFNGNPHDIGLL